MRQALWQLLNDFLSAILFLVVYLVSGNLVVAAALAIAAGLAQLARLKLTGRVPIQWRTRLLGRGRMIQFRARLAACGLSANSSSRKRCRLQSLHLMAPGAARFGIGFSDHE